MSWSHPVPILIPSVVKNVLSDPTSSFPIFYFPAFIFSAPALVDFAPSALFVAKLTAKLRLNPD